MDGESLVLNGPCQYSYVSLGNGSRLVLESCALSVTGDQFNDPFITGTPSQLIIRNSTVDVIGLDAPGLYRTGGQNSSVIVQVKDRFELSATTVNVHGGQGMDPVQEGCYYSSRVAGTKFKGGNATFILDLIYASKSLISGSTISVLGGKGGDAPRGQNILTLGSQKLPGGYTKGGDVCGEVGRGGSAILSINGTSTELEIDGSMLTVIGGKGARAGDGGYFTSSLAMAYDIPLPPGGYTAGMYSTSGSVLPGSVSGNVGMGGVSYLGIKALSLDLKGSTIWVKGGEGGDSGMPGCGTFPTMVGTSYIRAGMGGAGYAGGAATPSGGQKGGDIGDNVGSGGNATIELDIDLEVLSIDNTIRCQGGMGGVPFEGGLSGCVESGSYPRGGGGGGGGFSGGGGGGLEAIGHTKTRGAAGNVGDDVGSGGDAKLSLRTRYSSGSGDCIVITSLGEAFSNEPLTGQDSISRSTGEILAEGGGGAIGKVIDGKDNLDYCWPAPILSSPPENGFLEDITRPFDWEPGSPSLGHPLFYRFRLLGSMNTSDVLEQSGLIGDDNYFLLTDPGDGVYYWSVWIDGQAHDSIWARPHRVILDRVAPGMDMPSERVWRNGSAPTFSIHAYDDVSGIAKGNAQFKVQKVGTISSEWYDADVKGIAVGEFALTANIPSVPGDYDAFFRTTDRAGNGPVIGGPYRISIDTMPPLIRNPTPSGWSDGTDKISFDLIETGSGPMGEVLMTAEGGIPSSSIHQTSLLVEEGGNRRSCSSGMVLGEGTWELTLCVSDLVGNVGTSEPFALRVDRTPPLVLEAYPSEGYWTNISQPTFSFRAADPGSGILTAIVQVLGPGGGIGTTCSASLSGDDIWTAIAGAGLSDGIHRWRVVLQDAVGNEFVTPVNTFGVDTYPPIVMPPRDHNVQGDDLRLDLGPVMETSGLVKVEVEPLLWGPHGWTERSAILFDDLLFAPDGSSSILMPAPSGPVAFMRVRGTDAAGNIGPWSEAFRVDIGGSDFGVAASEEAFHRAGSDIEMIVNDGLGVDIGSLELVVRGKDGRPLHPAVRTTIEEKKGLPSSDDTLHPVSVRLNIDTTTLSGKLSLELRWNSTLPLGEQRSVAWKGPVMDAEPPVLGIHAPSYLAEVNFPIRLTVRDATSGPDISSMTVEVGAGNISGCNGPGEPSLERVSSGEYDFRVNLTWGVRTIVKVGVSDLVGHEAAGQVDVVATRPPEVQITSERSLDGQLTLGTHLELKASTYDPDLETLTVRWTVNGTDAGDGPVLDLVLIEPKINVTVFVSDGHYTVSDSVIINAMEQERGDGKDLPLLTAVILSMVMMLIVMVIATITVILFLAARKKRADDGEAEDWGVDVREKRVGSGRGPKGKVYSTPGSSKGRGGAVGCSICLRGLKTGSEHPRCRCGARFHKACAMRKGVCPDCGREIMLKAD
jgi:hypothetical protein